MKLINDNLKIIEQYGFDKNSEAYIVESLEGGVDKYMLEILDDNIYKSLIQDYIDYNKTYKNLSHKYILKTIDFKRVESINLKPVYGNFYYMLTEYNKWKSLNKIRDYKAKDIALVFIKLFAVIDFLHFREFSYDFLTPDNIFISDEYDIKLSSIGTIIGYTYEKEKHISNYKYISPDLFKPHSKTDFSRDYHSLGFLLEEFLLPSIGENEKTHRDYIIKMIDNLKLKDSDLNQYNKLKYYAKGLSSLFMIDYTIDYKLERQRLYFDINPIGIEDYIVKTLEIDKTMRKGLSKVNGLIVSGKPGTGKSKILNEINNRLEIEGCNIYKIDIDNNDLMKIDALRRFVIQLVDALNIEYEFLQGTDIIYVSSEDSKKQYNLNILDDKYNLLNRIAEQFISVSRVKPAYISIGNLSAADLDIFNDIDFIISRIKLHNVVFLFTLDFETIESEELKRILNNWIDNGTFVEFKLKNLNENDTIQFIQSIVGSNSFPLEFSKLIYRESLGNPRYLDILIRHFFDTKEIFINMEGEWEIRTSDYDDIYFPQNFTETIKTSFNTLSKLESKVLEIISCFESSASEDILSEMMCIEKKYLDKLIDGLVEKRILSKNLSEKSNRLFFNEGELKRHIYNEISDLEKIEYHSKLSDLFLQKRANGKSIDFNSLLKHISGAGKLDLLYEIIQERIHSEKTKNNDVVVVLLELLFSKLENKKHDKRLIVVEQLIDCYISIGNYSGAEPYIDKLEVISKELNLKHKSISAELYRFEIYTRTNNLLNAKQLSKKIRSMPYIKANKKYLLEYIRIEAMYLQALGRNKETISLLKRAIDLSIKSNVKISLGDFYNLIGIAYYFEGQHEKALENYELSIKEYSFSPNFYNVVKPLSNIGSIYNEVYSLPAKALDYFLQSYNTAVENNLLVIQSLLLNNIGEVYFNMADFEHSEIYFKKSIHLSKLNNDRAMEYLATINLGLTNISREKLRDAVQIFHTLRRMNKQDPIIDAEISMKYMYFLGFFHTALGDLLIGKKYSQVSADKSKDISLIEYMKASSRIFYIDSILKMKIDSKELESLIMAFRDQGNVLDRAFFILDLSYLSLRLDEKDLFAYLIEEFNTIESPDVLEVINDDVKILNNLYSDDKSLLIETLNLLNEKDVKLSVSHIRYLSHLGKKFYELELYDYAIKALLRSLDLFYKTVYDLGIEGYEEKLEFYYSIDQIKKLLVDVIRNGLNIDVGDLNNYIKNNYYDLRLYLNLLSKEDIARIYYSKEDLKAYKDLISLTLNFYGGYETNINQLLKFIGLHTMAENVTLKVFNYPDIGETSEYSYNQNNEEVELNTVISKAINEGEIILINKSYESTRITGYEDYISQEQVAIIGLPIFEPEKDYIINEKRLNYKKREVYASLIASTSSGVNMFDEEALNLLKGVSKLLHLNLENGKLFRKSNYDKLTGVLTRSSIEKSLEELTQENVEINSNFAVMMLDIDRFKSVNDTYGHQAGDKVLSCIGSIIKNTLRTSDYVGRYGGEEFLLILDNINKEDSIKVAKKILTSIENYEGFGIKEKVTVSIGISKYPDHTIFKDELIYKADQALYYAKEVLRRNQVALWNSEMEDIENIQSYVHSIAFGGFANNNNNLISLVDISLMNRQEHSIEDKIFSFLGILMDATEAEVASLFFINTMGLKKQYTRKIAIDTFIEDVNINNELLKRALKSNESFTFIEWHPNSLEKTDNFSIKSLILSPVLFNGRLRGIVYLEVPLKRKEFTNDNIGFVETLSGVFSGNL